MPLILFNKPFRVLSQFTDQEQRQVLADFVPNPDVYPAGRLDFDSEGLLLLTDDGRLQAAISSPDKGIIKRYWSQVDGKAETQPIERLLEGVNLKDGFAAAIEAMVIPPPDSLWPRDPPIRVRKNLPTDWLAISIAEGRNRQIRRMTAAVGLPTLRLIRHTVGPWSLGNLQPGESREYSTKTAWQALRDYSDAFD